MFVSEGMKMKKGIKIGLLCICIVIFVVAAYQIGRYVIEQKENKELQQDLMEKVITETPKEEASLPEALPITIDFDKLKETNPEVVGWIYIVDTRNPLSSCAKYR